MREPITYTVLAADGQHYGPYPAENIQAWINEGRVGANQQMTRSDLKEWFRAGDFSEFVWTSAPVPVAATPPPQPTPIAVEQPRGNANRGRIDAGSTAGIRSGASWFYWIAGLSAVNLVLELVGANFGFAVGSAAFDVCVALSRSGGQFNLLPALGAGLVIGGWALLGYFASRASRAAFIIGVILFTLDTLLLLRLGASSFIGVAIHGYILFRLSIGLRDAFALHKLGRD